MNFIDRITDRIRDKILDRVVKIWVAKIGI